MLGKRLACAAVLLFQLALGLAFIRSAAPTYDESVHLASGYSYLATGRYRLNIRDHPPLAEMWAALPLLAVRPHVFPSSPDWLAGRVYNYADTFLYQNKLSGESMVNLGRVFCLLTWSCLLAWALADWAVRLGGPGAAPWALGAGALCPVLVSNLALVTTDGAAAVFFFLFFWILSAEPRTMKGFAAAGAAAGLALASKFNMVILAPLALGVLAVERGIRPPPRPRLPLRGVGLAAACAAGVLAIVYRFGQLPLYWEGLTATFSRLDQGRSAFLMGMYSTRGFWLYFPVALAIKTPLPVLLLAGYGAFLWLKPSSERRQALWVLLPAAGYFLAAAASKLQIGVRHLLPMMPFIALAAGCGAQALWKQGGRGRAAASALAAWLAFSVLSVAPHLLAYFNEAVGPAQGYRYLVDSNLDWGQELKGLSEELKALGDPPVYLAYFGTADPAAYGIRYLPVAFSNQVDRLLAVRDVDPASSGRVLFAVSATHLQGTYFADKTLFAWLKDRKPLKIVGYSIFLYDLTSDRDGRARLAELVKLSGFPGRAAGLLVQ